MDAQLVVICLLTAGINLIGTLAYGARIAGVRTRRIAMSFALFNILVLVSRMSNSFLGPFLAKRIEARLHAAAGGSLLSDFRLVLLAASLAVLAGILLVPAAQRIFARAIAHFQEHRSTTRLLLRAATPAGLRTIRDSLALPDKAQLRAMTRDRGVDVIEGRIGEPLFRRTVAWISFSRLAGTVLAQMLFVPAALAIAWDANRV